MRDYWLSRLFYDLQDPSLAAEYRQSPEKVYERYRLTPEVREALARNDVPFFAQRVNPYLLRFYCYGIGMKDEEFMQRLRDG